MKLFHCGACGRLVLFENTTCLSCSRLLAFLPDQQVMAALELGSKGLSARFRLAELDRVAGDRKTAGH